MEICTLTRTPGTTLRSNVSGMPAFGWRGRGDTCVTAATPPAASRQGGAIAQPGMAAVTDLMVIDHQLNDHCSTRPGSCSCSPPV